MIRAVSSALLAAGLAAGLTVPATTTPSPSPTAADPVRAAEYWLDGYGVSQAWQKTKGAGVKIAVIDTGIARVPELDAAVVGGTDMSGAGSPDGRTPVGVVDGNHGTWVASLAAARGTGERTGMIGVAPEAQLLSVSVGFGASAKVPFVDQIAEGMRWAVDNGANVINLSLTTNTLSWDEKWDDAFSYAFDHDVVVVVAAGNRGSGTTTVGAPATIPGVLTVAGVDPAGKASTKASTQGITIGVAAPSEKLLGISADGKLASWEGTSGAAPLVSGIAALVRATYPDMDANNVINTIVQTAKAVPGVATRPDPLYGYGLVNAAAAVTTAVPKVEKNPMGSLQDWIRLYRRGQATPVPQETSGPQVSLPPLPAPDGPVLQGSPLLPTQESMLHGTIPLVAVTLPGILILLGVTAAVRRIRSARKSRTPSK